MNAYELAEQAEGLAYEIPADWSSCEPKNVATDIADMLRQQADRIAEMEKQLQGYQTATKHYREKSQIKELSDIDLTLILEVLIDSYDDTNRCYLEYKAMWEKSPTRKARIDGMKRMVYKHANAIEKIEAILKKASEK